MPRSKRTAVRSLKSHPKACPCKKCTTGKHDPTCTCPECGHNRLLTKAKRSKRGHKKQDGGRVYLGMIDDESYYSPPVVAGAGPAAAAPAAPLPGPGPGPGPFPLVIPVVLPSLTHFTTFPTYAEISAAANNRNTDFKTLITSGGGIPATGVANATLINKNILREMYYPTEAIIT